MLHVYVQNGCQWDSLKFGELDLYSTGDFIGCPYYTVMASLQLAKVLMSGIYVY
jgi:hypothetical protein